MGISDPSVSPLTTFHLTGAAFSWDPIHRIELLSTRSKVSHTVLVRATDLQDLLSPPIDVECKFGRFANNFTFVTQTMTIAIAKTAVSSAMDRTDRSTSCWSFHHPLPMRANSVSYVCSSFIEDLPPTGFRRRRWIPKPCLILSRLPLEE